ncbi:MAG: LPS export ABC transporter permease LptF [Lautropia sp.]
MIFSQSLKRDLNSVAGVMFSTLFTIMVTTSLIRFLGRAATDRIASADVVPLIAFSSIGYIPVLLVLTVFLSIIMVLSRAWRDSEMVIWFASGQSLTAWIRPVLSFALPYTVAVGLIALVVSPWANRQIVELRERFEQREDVSQVAAGQFRESRSSNRVFFVESVNKEQTEVSNVFVVQRAGSRLIVVASRGGEVDTQPNGDRFLVLEDGRRYDGNWGGSEYSLMEFERYGVRLEPSPSPIGKESPRALTTPQLFASLTPRNLGELMDRIGLPVSVIVISLLAIPLAFVNPRLGRSLNIVFGLLIYFTYTNLNGLMQSWISQDRLSFSLGVWISHALLLAIAAFLFYRRMHLPQVSLGRLLVLLLSLSRARRGSRAGATGA